ncbi:MAG TPA: biotin/lipoyl-containing protein [Thermoanaerobaculia bacterium]|jgi:acetyl-CoA/propionyl-CoA carboxylase biotin carboxyl carrier protein
MSGLRLRCGAELREVRLESDAAVLDGRRVAFERVERDGELAAVRIDGKEHPVVTAVEGSRTWVWCDGFAGAFERVAAARSGAGAASPRETGGDLISPMPGRVRRLLVEDGARVARGDVLLVLEAMKMEHAIRSPMDGTVRLRVAEGDLVEAGIELAAVESPSS